MNISHCRANLLVPAILAHRLLITGHNFFGGVAERLIAPVLKTGRPKGLVSSNLTPSGQLSFEFQLAIADFQEEEVHHDNCA